MMCCQSMCFFCDDIIWVFLFFYIFEHRIFLWVVEDMFIYYVVTFLVILLARCLSIWPCLFKLFLCVIPSTVLNICKSWQELFEWKYKAEGMIGWVDNLLIQEKTVDYILNLCMRVLEKCFGKWNWKVSLFCCKILKFMVFHIFFLIIWIFYEHVEYSLYICTFFFWKALLSTMNY